jgi:hypothetical protein
LFGSEYVLLMDSRFKKLKVETLVVEWDATPEHPHADGEIAARLRHLGRSLYCGGGARTRSDGLALRATPEG